MKQVLLVDPGRESSRHHRLGYLSGNTEKIRFCNYLYYSKRPGAGHIKGKLCGISPGGCGLGNRQINIKKTKWIMEEIKCMKTGKEITKK